MGQLVNGQYVVSMDLGKYILELWQTTFTETEIGFDERGSFAIVGELKLHFGWSEYEGEVAFPLTLAVKIQDLSTNITNKKLEVASQMPAFGAFVIEQEEDTAELYMYCHQFLVRDPSIDRILLQASVQEFFFYLGENDA